MVDEAKISAGLTNSNTALIRLQKGDSLATGAVTLKNLSGFKNQEGIYFSCNANSPVDFLKTYLRGHQIPLDKVFFLDTVTNTILGKNSINNANTFFSHKNDPRSFLWDLAKVLQQKPNINYIYLDSVTELLNYHDKDLVLGFMYEFLNVIKEFNMSGVILSFYGENEEYLLDELKRLIPNEIRL